MSTDVDFSSTLTTSEWISLIISFLGLPLSLTLSLLTSPFSPRNQSKPTGRIIRDDMMRYFVDRLSMRQVRAVLPNSQSAYETWARSEGVGSVVDEVGGGSRVFWVGERPGRLRGMDKGGDRVLVYCHGGGYWCPMNPHQIRFMQRIRKELALSGIHTSIAVVPYTLYPATYPAQVNDLTRVVNYILSLGVSPSNIQFVGDSAGGNLILQFLSQWLHPDAKNGVPIVSPSLSNTNVSADTNMNTNTNKDTTRNASIRPRFGGAVLISPWVSLDPTSPSQISNDPFDSITSRGLREWGRAYMAPLEGDPTLRAYVDPVYASTVSLGGNVNLDSKAEEEAEAWWARAGGCLPRVMITVGGKECLRDDITHFANTLRRQTQPPTPIQTPTLIQTLIPTPTQTGTGTEAVDITLDIQPDGVHIDPFPDYATRLASARGEGGVEGEGEMGVVMERIVKWLGVGFGGGFGGGFGYGYGEAEAEVRGGKV